MSTWDDKPNDYEHALLVIEALRKENADLRRWKALDKPLTAAMGIANAEIERLRAENIKVSCHCAALIQTLRDLGEPDEVIAAIAQRGQITDRMQSGAADYVVQQQPQPEK